MLDLAARGRTTDVERSHRELSTRLANRLAGDDSDGLSDVHLVAACEISPVAFRAHPPLCLARQHGANDHFLDARLFDDLHEVLF